MIDNLNQFQQAMLLLAVVLSLARGEASAFFIAVVLTIPTWLKLADWVVK